LIGFRAALRREGLAEGTQTKYAQIVREWIDRLGGDEATLAATRSDADAYLDHLLVEEELGVATVRLRIAALRRFYDHIEERDLLPDRNPFARIKPPKQRRKPNDWLHPDEDEAIYEAAVSPQERILHALLRYAGLRIGEATALIQRNVDLDRNELRV